MLLLYGCSELCFELLNFFDCSLAHIDVKVQLQRIILRYWAEVPAKSPQPVVADRISVMALLNDSFKAEHSSIQRMEKRIT